MGWIIYWSTVSDALGPLVGMEMESTQVLEATQVLESTQRLEEEGEEERSAFTELIQPLLKINMNMQIECSLINLDFPAPNQKP